MNTKRIDFKTQPTNTAHRKPNGPHAESLSFRMHICIFTNLIYIRVFLSHPSLKTVKFVCLCRSDFTANEQLFILSLTIFLDIVYS